MAETVDVLPLYRRILNLKSLPVNMFMLGWSVRVHPFPPAPRAQASFAILPFIF